MAVKSRPAQQFVPIKEVRDGIAVLKDGSMRMVLMASSLNFALKSVEEQEAILAQFRNFLNSLEYSTQLLVQSRRLDIRPYISVLEERQKAQLGDLMRIQIREYVDFVNSFTDAVNIMTKSFFIVVPYTPRSLLAANKRAVGSLLARITGKTEGEGAENEPAVDIDVFEEARSQLEQRANVVKQGLARTGIRVVPLGTEEVTELYYRIFNPSDTEEALKH